MKVVHVIQRYPPAIGGSEVWLREIALRLATQHGHRVEVQAIALHEEQEYYEHFATARRQGAYGENQFDGPVEIVRHRPSVPHHRLVRHVLQPLQKLTGTYLEGPHSLDLYRALPAAIRDADVVHFHAHPFPHVSIGLWLCRRIGRPAVVTPYFHPRMPAHLGKRSIKALAMAERIFVLTEHERSSLVARGLDADRIVMTGCGIDVDRYEALSRLPAPPDLNLSKSSGVHRLVYIGRKTSYKGLDTLIEAVRRVRERRQVELLLVGPASRWFTERLASISSSDRAWIRDLGVLSEADKVAVLRASNVLVQPSAHESFGLVFLEAWASGLPVIGVDSGAVPSVIGEGGLTFRAGDAGSLAAAIVRLLDEPSTARTCAQIGDRRNRELYSWDRLAATVSATYHRVCGKPRRILVVSGIYPPHSFGGAEVMARTGAVGLARRGYEVKVLGTYRDSNAERWRLTTSSDEGTEVQLYTVKEYDNHPGYARHHHAPEAVEAFQEIIQGWRPDVVHFHNIQTLSHRLIDIAENAGIATLMTLHDYWAICFKHTRMLDGNKECPRNGYACLSCRNEVVDAPDVSMIERNAAVRASFDRLRLLLAPSRYLLDRFVENGIPKERFRHQPYGIDLTRFVKVAAARRPRTPLRLGFIGYIGDHKGIFVLAKAVHLLVGDFKMLIYGVGDYANQLAPMLAPLGEKVEMCGPVPNDRIADAFESIDVMVLPSVWPENFPVSILEAFASAAVVVGSDSGGMREQIIPNENGYLVTTGDAVALAVTLQRLIDDPALVARLSQGALRSSERYPLDQYLDTTESFYADAFHSMPQTLRSRPVLIHSGLHNDSGGRVVYRALGELSRHGREVEALAMRHATDADLEQALAVVLTPGADDAVELALRAFVYRRPVLAPRSDADAVQLVTDAQTGVLYDDSSDLARRLEELTRAPQEVTHTPGADAYLRRLLDASMANT